MNGITNWFQNIDMGDPNWVMAICAILTIIGGAGAFIVKKLIGLVAARPFHGTLRGHETHNRDIARLHVLGFL